MNRETGAPATGLSALPERAEALVAASPPALPANRPENRREKHLRGLDLIVAINVFLVILPVMLLIALLIKCSSPGPVIFAHGRVGRGGRMFSCLKFRSMAADADDRLSRLLATDPVTGAEWARAHKLRRDPRITRFGAFLRKTSLDELPQLFNVLRGDMSLVGPRPIVPGEIFRYGHYIRDYCSVRPGITGLWQISGRNNVSYRRRVALDVTYIRARSLWLNIYILAVTFPRVLLAEGSY